jgi:hypothetical protein
MEFRMVEGRGRKPKILLMMDNVPKSLKQISQEYGIPYITLSKRYHKGLRGEDLLKVPDYFANIDADTKTSENGLANNKPNEPKKRGAQVEILVTFNGKLMSIKDLAKEYNLAYGTVLHRHKANKQGYELVKPVSNAVKQSNAWRAYEKQIMKNRSR